MAREPMFAHELNGVQGFTPGAAWVVEKVAEGDLAYDYDTDLFATAADFVAGSVVHLDASQSDDVPRFRLGAGPVTLTGGSLISMKPTYILFNSGEDNDTLVDNPNFNSQFSAFTTTVGNGGTGPNLHGFAVAQAAEVQTTEFISASYEVGEALTTTIESGDTDTAAEVTSLGKVRKTTGTDVAQAVIGFVTKAVEANDYGVDMLQFQTAFLPVAYGAIS